MKADARVVKPFTETNPYRFLFHPVQHKLLLGKLTNPFNVWHSLCCGYAYQESAPLQEPG